jgi:hypothetical protein
MKNCVPVIECIKNHIFVFIIFASNYYPCYEAYYSCPGEKE